MNAAERSKSRAVGGIGVGSFESGSGRSLIEKIVFLNTLKKARPLLLS